ncbi:MAG: hypothetical protein ACN4GZ_10180, partial [Acidimicrobiales bacterium]
QLDTIPAESDEESDAADPLSFDDSDAPGAVDSFDTVPAPVAPGSTTSPTTSDAEPGSTTESTSRITAPATTSTTISTQPTVDSDGFLPPGSALPTDDACRAQVQSAPEVRAANVQSNSRAGGPTLSGAEFGRVTGNMTGTTDEIIQWAACKWGLPADIVRAQAATETWWRQGFLGDWTETAADCAPGHSLGSDGKANECPQSIGILQIKYKFFKDAFPGASESTAYSLDYAYAVWRNCYEGRQTWLNDSERGREYAAGDGWGCIGRWYAGEWYTPRASNYISEVERRLTTRVWATSEFLSEG